MNWFETNIESRPYGKTNAFTATFLKNIPYYRNTIAERYSEKGLRLPSWTNLNNQR
jgi:dTDP-4-amino-4,6-dideoxygalactose transaminase